jgi:hypothetical protein
MLPKQVPNAVFRESIAAGHVYITYSEFNVLLSSMKADWAGNKYHLLKRNCNSFSKALLAALGLKAPAFINRLASAGDTLANIVPSFMLPKQVNMLIQSGRPDMQPAEDAPPQPQSARGGQAAAAGIPTLSGQQQQQQRGGVPVLSNRGAPPAASPSPSPLAASHFANADGLDDEQFALFLAQSEREYQRELAFKAMREGTDASAAAAAAGWDGADVSTRPRPASASSPQSFSSRTATASGLAASQPPLTPAEEAQVERAMADFNLPPDVNAAERAQIRQVLAISIRAGAKI